MGCCRSKSQKKNKKVLSSKALHTDTEEKETQQKVLKSILETVESQIQTIKDGVTSLKR